MSSKYKVSKQEEEKTYFLYSKVYQQIYGSM